MGWQILTQWQAAGNEVNGSRMTQNKTKKE